MCCVVSSQVTIRASITGKSPALPNSPDRSGFTVSSETLSFNQQTKPPVSVSKSKSDGSAAGKNKMTQGQKQQRNKTKHNLALRNLGQLSGLFNPEVRETGWITYLYLQNSLLFQIVILCEAIKNQPRVKMQLSLKVLVCSAFLQSQLIKQMSLKGDLCRSFYDILE